MTKPVHPCRTRILIVEGKIHVAADLERRLTKMGHEICSTAATCEDALEQAGRWLPDLVMMDIALKGGMDAAGIFRDRWDLPVVFLATHQDTDQLERAGLTGHFNYLLKPFRDKDLRIAVAMALYVGKVEAERRKAAHALEISERNYRLLADNAGDVIFTLDMDLRYTYVSPSVWKLRGFTASEIMGQGLGDVLTQPSLQTARRIISEELEAEASGEADPGRSRTMELEMLRKDGSTVWTEVKCSFLRDDGGKPSGILGVTRDISDRKRTEAELCDSESRFQKMLALVPDMISIHDPEMNIVYSNWRGFGAVPETKRVRYTKCYRTYRGYDDICPDCRAKTVFESGKTFQEEALLPDGRWMDVRVIPLLDEQGRVELFMEWVRDITESKLSEEETGRLQAQLQQAQKMEAVGTLAGGVAHDFNNLLQAITGYAQMLLMDKDAKDPAYTPVSAILKSGRRAADLVRQLLLFSRKAETERRPLELNREVEQTRRIMGRTLPKMVDIVVHAKSRLWKIHADPVQIEQILLNLGTNAADAMPEGGRLTIETENVALDPKTAQNHLDAKPGRYVLLTVSDTGHGMDEETIAKSFDPFFTTKEIGKGTGLGLASVYGIVKSHGGHIHCTSEPGRGTTFKIYLPAAEEQVDTDPEGRVAGTPRGGTETILVVDDEESIRTIASQILRKFGYRVLTAATGEKALEIYAASPDDIDLVIMDIGMPGMGGHRCLQEIIRMDPTARILIASGYAFDGQINDALKAGAVGYVGKPYQLDDLLSKVRTVVEKRER